MNQSDGFWTQYWTDFQRQYRARDEDGILARMEPGRHNDLFASEAVIKDLFGREDGIQFGLAKRNRSGMRKVEIRVSEEEVFRRYFAADLPEIIARIERIGGTYAPRTPEKVINCYFEVLDNAAASYERIFEVFEKFKEIVLDYYLERK